MVKRPTTADLKIQLDRIETKVDGASLWAYFATAAAGAIACFSFANIFKSFILSAFGIICSIFTIVLLVYIFKNFLDQRQFENH